jgi:hypothetical protein
MADLGDRLVEALHDGQKLESGDEPVPCRRVIRHDDMAGLLAAEIEAVGAHMLQHIAVADGGAHEAEPEAAQITLKA